MLRTPLTRVTLTQLAELSVSDDQGPQCAQSLQSLVAVLLGSILIDWRIWGGDRARIKLLSLPDEVLQKISFVFGEQKQLCLVDNLLEIRDKRPSFLRKSFGRAC